jgi:hypothetical protein
MSRQDRKRAVNLLSQHNPRKLMRQRNAAQRKQEIGALSCRSGPTIRRPNGEDQALRTIVAQPPQMRGKLLRTKLLTPAIKKNHVRSTAARTPIQPFEQRLFRFKQL